MTQKLHDMMLFHLVFDFNQLHFLIFILVFLIVRRRFLYDKVNFCMKRLLIMLAKMNNIRWRRFYKMKTHVMIYDGLYLKDILVHIVEMCWFMYKRHDDSCIKSMMIHDQWTWLVMYKRHDNSCLIDMIIHARDMMVHDQET